MSTTDRITQLDTQRTITDRLGETVTLGNSVSGAVLDIDAGIVAAQFGATSEAKVPALITVLATVEWANASFGDWFSDLSISTVALLQMTGASTAGVPFSHITTGLLTWGADAMLLNIRVFTSTQAYTPTSGTAKVVVHCIGAGGGGGGAATSATPNVAIGGSGGAGALATGIITSGFSGVTITIGAGGTGGAAGANAGANGGATTFGSALSGGGGTGGTAGTSTATPAGRVGSIGGSASGASSLFGAIGESGELGFSTGATSAITGAGGSTLYGAGGRGAISGGGSDAGDAGTGFGAGGSGGLTVNSAASAGGNGADGLCIVYEYNA